MGHMLCGKLELQKIAYLPTPGPPFTTVGMDAFDSWKFFTRKTSGGLMNNKRWAIMFSCSTTGANM